MIWSRRKVVTGLGATITPLFGSRANAERAGSISLASRATAAITVTPAELEAASITRRKRMCAAVCG